MATRTQAVTAEPAALAGTTDDTFFSIQNSSTRPIKLAVASAAPDATAPSTPRFVLHPGQVGSAKHPAGEDIYVWASGPARVDYEEAE